VNESRLEQVVTSREQAQTVRNELNTNAQDLSRARDIAAIFADEAEGAAGEEAQQRELQQEFEALLAEAEGAQTRIDDAIAQDVADRRAEIGERADEEARAPRFDAESLRNVSADEIGRGASEQFENLNSLRELDLRNANREQVQEALSVLDRAREDNDRAIVGAERQDRVLQAAEETFRGVVGALGGDPDAIRGPDSAQAPLNQQADATEAEATATAETDGSESGGALSPEIEERARALTELLEQARSNQGVGNRFLPEAGSIISIFA
jgi:hypothetical protein